MFPSESAWPRRALRYRAWLQTDLHEDDMPVLELAIDRLATAQFTNATSDEVPNVYGQLVVASYLANVKKDFQVLPMDARARWGCLPLPTRPLPLPPTEVRWTSPLSAPRSHPADRGPPLRARAAGERGLLGPAGLLPAGQDRGAEAAAGAVGGERDGHCELRRDEQRIQGSRTCLCICISWKPLVATLI